MPRMATFGISVEVVKRLSRPLIDDLVALTKVPRDHFTIQVNNDIFVHDGVEVLPDPFVEICLFERGESTEDAFAKIVTKHFQDNGVTSIDVYITHLERRRYFENGNHF